MKKEQLILPISILLASLIIGGFYYATQLNKQNSIEKQQVIKIEAEKQAQSDLVAKEEAIAKQASDEKATNKTMYNLCVSRANDTYWDYMELNGTGKRDDEKGVWADQDIWDTGDKRKQQAIDNCFIQYMK